MPRTGIDPGYQTALASGLVRPIELVKLVTDAKTLTFTSGDKAYTYASDNYPADGKFVSIQGHSERADDRIGQMKLVLTGLDAALRADIMSKKLHYQPVYWYLGLLDENHNLINNTVLQRGKWYVSQPKLVLDGKEIRLEIICEPPEIDERRKRGVIASGADQRARHNYSDDSFCDHIPMLEEMYMEWGYISAGGSGGCLAETAWMNPWRRARSIRRAGIPLTCWTAERGIHRGQVEGTPRTHLAQWVQLVTETGARVTVSNMTPLDMPDGRQVLSKDALGEVLLTESAWWKKTLAWLGLCDAWRWETIVAVNTRGTGRVVRIFAGHKSYAASDTRFGRRMMTHNKMDIGLPDKLAELGGRF